MLSLPQTGVSLFGCRYPCEKGTLTLDAAIGLAAKGERVYGLADGSELRMSVTTADVEFMGEIVGSTIVMGDEASEPLLGVTALESVGIEVDPRNWELWRLPFVRL